MFYLIMAVTLLQSVEAIERVINNKKHNPVGKKGKQESYTHSLSIERPRT